jgi:hypothetical protein
MRSISCLIIAVLVLAFLPMAIWAADFMYWDDFDPIALLSIASQAQTREGSATVTLFTNGNAEISANNTPSGPAELSCATDTLVTEYMLSFDGDGSSATGAEDTTWAEYNTFITTAYDITYVTDDNDVDVTLWVRASNNADEVADADTYNAVQTLTVSWVGP